MTCPPVSEYLCLPRGGLPHEFPAKAAVRLLHTQEPGASARMRQIASAAIQELQLDYTVTLVSGGASKNVEIVIWDKTRDSYFSLRLACEPGTPSETIATRIKDQLRRRLAALQSGSDTFRERRPLRSVASGRQPTLPG